MSQLLKRIVVAQRDNILIEDLCPRDSSRAVFLRKAGDSRDLLAYDAKNRPMFTLEEISASRSLDNLVQLGYLKLYDENGTELNNSSGGSAEKATNLATLKDLDEVTGGGGFSDPMTSRGDIIYRDSLNTTSRLSLGTSKQILTSNGSDITWSTIDSSYLSSQNISQWINDSGYLIDLSSESFLELSDTPSSYVGKSGYFVKVNATGTALEFTAVAGGFSPVYGDLQAGDALIYGYSGGYGIEGEWSNVDPVHYLSVLGFTTEGHVHTSSDITDFSEEVDDRVSSLIQDGVGISWVYDDGANTLTANVSNLTVNEFSSQNISQWTNDSGYLVNISGESFLNLSDTPDTYSGKSGYYIKVNNTEDGLEFSVVSGGGDFSPVYSNLTDGDILTYGLSYGYGVDNEWSNVDPIDYFTALGFITTERQTLDDVTILGNITNNNITTGDHTINGAITTVDPIQFNISSSTPSHSEGQIYWDQDDKTLTMNTDVNGVNLQIGQEMFLRAVNKTGSTIFNGQVVYVDGAQGNRPTVSLAIASDANSSHKVIGMATADIPNNQNGYITLNGLVRDINTLLYENGDELYLSESIAGGFANSEPSILGHRIKIGTVINSHATEGVVYVNVQNGIDLEKIDDVLITSIKDGDVLFFGESYGYGYDSAWSNVNLLNYLSVLGFSSEGHTHDTSDITSGTFDDARISESNVTQHQSALSITESQISDLDHYDSTDFDSDFSSKTTDNLPQGVTNLYYSNELVDDQVSSLIQDGTGISWVYNDGSGTLTPTVSISPFTTTDLTEGLNLYYTDERVDDRISNLIQNGIGISWTYDDGANTLTGNVGGLTVSEFTSQNISQWTNDSGYLTDITGESFLDLSDTPSSYSGKSGYYIKVNNTEDGLEFSVVSSGGSDFSPIYDSLTDGDILIYGYSGGYGHDGEWSNVDPIDYFKLLGFYGQEETDDRVANLLQDGTEISWTYNDSLGTLTPVLDQTLIDHVNLLNIGTNTHSQIDAHIVSTSNPHDTSDANLLVSDITTNNVTQLAHGFTPKLSGSSVQFLNGEGNWVTPVAGTANAYISQSYSNETSVVVSHNFGAYPVVQVLISTSVAVPYSISHGSVNQFTVTFTTPQSGTVIATLGAPQLNNYTVTANDYTANNDDYLIEATGIGKTITLPTASGVTSKIYIIKNTSSGTVEVKTTGGETLDNQTTLYLKTFESISVYSNGNNWMVF